MTQLNMHDLCFSSDINTHMSEEYDTHEQVRFLNAVRVSFEPSNLLPEVYNLHQHDGGGQYILPEKVPAVRGDTYETILEKNKLYGRWAIIFAMRIGPNGDESPTDQLPVIARMAGLFPEDCVAAVVIDAPHRRSWSECFLRCNELGIYMVHDELMFTCSQRVEIDHGELMKVLPPSLPMPMSEHEAEKLSKHVRQVLATRYLMRILGPLDGYFSREVWDNPITTSDAIFEVARNATFGIVDVPWVNTYDKVLGQHRSTQYFSIPLNSPEGLACARVLSAFEAVVAQSALLRRMGIDRLGYHDYIKSQLADELMLEFGVDKIVKAAYEDDEKPVEFVNSDLKFKVANLIDPEPTHEWEQKAGKRGSLAKIEEEEFIGYSRTANVVSYANFPVVKSITNVLRMINAGNKSTLTTVMPGSWNFYHIETRSLWNARFYGLAKSLEDKQKFLSGNKIAIAIMDGNANDISSYTCACPVLAGAVDPNTDLIVLRAPWDSIDEHVLFATKGGIEQIPVATVVWDEAGLFFEEPTRNTMLSDENGELQITSLAGVEQGLIDKINEITQLKAASLAISKILSNNCGDLGMADYATELLSFGEMTRFPIEASDNIDDVFAGAQMAMATKCVLGKFANERYDTVVGMRDIWDALLEREGLGLHRAFPAGVSKEHFWNIGRRIGIDSAIDAYLGGVPVEYLI